MNKFTVRTVAWTSRIYEVEAESQSAAYNIMQAALNDDTHLDSEPTIKFMDVDEDEEEIR